MTPKELRILLPNPEAAATASLEESLTKSEVALRAKFASDPRVTVRLHRDTTAFQRELPELERKDVKSWKVLGFMGQAMSQGGSHSIDVMRGILDGFSIKLTCEAPPVKREMRIWQEWESKLYRWVVAVGFIGAVLLALLLLVGVLAMGIEEAWQHTPGDRLWFLAWAIWNSGEAAFAAAIALGLGAGCALGVGVLVGRVGWLFASPKITESERDDALRLVGEVCGQSRAVPAGLSRTPAA